MIRTVGKSIVINGVEVYLPSKSLFRLKMNIYLLGFAIPWNTRNACIFIESGSHIRITLCNPIRHGEDIYVSEGDYDTPNHRENEEEEAKVSSGSNFT